MASGVVSEPMSTLPSRRALTTATSMAFSSNFGSSATLVNGFAPSKLAEPLPAMGL